MSKFKVINIIKFSKMTFHLPNMRRSNNYEDAINALNGLISNSNTIEKSIEKGTDVRLEHIPRTKMFCERAGIQMAEINNLKVVHVAGTKGKGSTSTYIDAILHHNGYKTGLFTSPHLTEVRERIKVNGDPISKSNFSHYFFHVYDRLNKKKASADDMPFYFQFLTIMAFRVFLDEQVDYVVLETGIGGRFDSTNIVESSKVACITSLGFDHMEILGHTMKEIGWNKAGIIKSGSLVVTCDSQPKDGLDSIIEESERHGNKLFLVPVKDERILDFMKDGRNIHPENALLASAVSHLILEGVPPAMTTTPSISDVIDLPLEYCTQTEYRRIIYSTKVTGRYQIIERDNIDYFIDGAHTVESMKTCVDWFKDVSSHNQYSRRYLIFMITGRRSIQDLLSQLAPLTFDGILLAPLVPFKDTQPPDFAPDDAIIARERAKLTEISATWHHLINHTQNNEDSAEYFNSFQDIEEWLTKREEKMAILVVGSLHLAGCALAVLGK